jgi:L-galactonate dehydratase
MAGVLNAVWDLWGKILRKPVWQIVADMTPQEFVQCIDFRYITDVITPESALAMLEKSQTGKSDRINEALANVSVPVSDMKHHFGVSALTHTRPIQRPPAG